MRKLFFLFPVSLIFFSCQKELDLYSSLGSSSRKRWGRQPETINPWRRLRASRISPDSRMASTLSSCAASMNEQVLTITTSASAGSLVISTPSFMSDPSMISASTRFLAQPKEMSPTLIGDGFEALLITITGQEGMRATPGWQIKRNNGDSRCPGRASCGTEKSDEIR